MNFRPLRVWSRIQRVIHWTIAFAVLLLIPLGLFIYFSNALKIPHKSVDKIMDIHAAVGFVLGAGVLCRIVYLFTGPATSNWRDVIPHTRAQWAEASATVRYYLSGFKGKPPLYFSHNAFAGIFDTILFIFLVTQAASGASMFFLHGEEHSHGAAHAAVNHAMENNAAPDPAADATAEGIPDWLLDLHDLGAVVVVFFTLSHFTALSVHDIVERRGLTSSMISGNKFFSEEELMELESKINEKKGRT